MIINICENVLAIFGTICAVSVMTLITYGVIIAFIEEFNIKFRWINNGVFKKRELHND